MSLSMTGKAMKIPKENGLRSKKYLNMQVRKKIFLLKKGFVHQIRDMDLSLESNKIKVVEENHCSVGFLEKITTRRIAYCITMENLNIQC